MGWTVYILRCGDGTLYTGCTNDLPVEPVYREEAADKSAALRREAAIKRLDRRKKLALIGEKEGQDGDSAAAGDGQPPGGQPDL